MRNADDAHFHSMAEIVSNTSTGRITTHDIEEQNRAASPWQVIHRQLSPGNFLGTTDYAKVNGILLYRQQYTKRVLVTGLTPAGFLALGGACTVGPQVRWCGEELSAQCLAYGFDSTETDFLIPDRSDHWVILVPKDLLQHYLGEESAAAVLRSRHVLKCESRLGYQLFNMVDRMLAKLRLDSGLQTNDLLLNAIEAQLLGTVAEVLFAADTDIGGSTPRKRYLACRRAISYADGLRGPISVPELAAAVGVSQRILELGFKETVGISPQKFLRWNRMNSLHRELRTAQKASSTVTELASHWGFHELGRTAVEYKQLFGESPSDTLTRKPRECERIGDVLLD